MSTLLLIRNKKNLHIKIFYFLLLISYYAELLKRESIIDVFYFAILFYFSLTFFVYFVIKIAFIKCKQIFIDKNKTV
jgi:hypothetical protein